MPKNPKKDNDINEVLNEIDDLIDLVSITGDNINVPWKLVPEWIQKDFADWLASYKQQSWEGNEGRGWFIYEREYLKSELQLKIEELKLILAVKSNA